MAVAAEVCFQVQITCGSDASWLYSHPVLRPQAKCFEAGAVKSLCGICILSINFFEQLLCVCMAGWAVGPTTKRMRTCILQEPVASSCWKLLLKRGLQGCRGIMHWLFQSVQSTKQMLYCFRLAGQRPKPNQKQRPKQKPWLKHSLSHRYDTRMRLPKWKFITTSPCLVVSVGCWPQGQFQHQGWFFDGILVIIFWLSKVLASICLNWWWIGARLDTAKGHHYHQVLVTDSSCSSKAHNSLLTAFIRITGLQLLHTTRTKKMK